MDSHDTLGLPQDWIYSPAIDLELKQYTLLGYLQRVKARFAERKLYPYLEHVRVQMKDLLHLQRSKDELARSMGGPLLGFDPHTGNPMHEPPEDDAVLKVIDEVIAFAVTGLAQVHSEGLDLRHELARGIRFEPIGLLPLHRADGWLLLCCGKLARVYHYTVPQIVSAGGYRGGMHIQTRYVTSYSVGLGHTYEQIKAELVQRHPQLPNPATFAVETDMDLPHIETFVPLAKQLVKAHLETAPY